MNSALLRYCIKHSLVLALLLLISGITVFAQENEDFALAVITELSGDVMVKDENGKTAKAKEDMVLEEGYTLVTGKKSEAEVTIDEDVVSVSEMTAIDVSKLSRQAETKETALKLWKGKLFVNVDKIKDLKTQFQVHTPTAVAGVRGTGFGIEVEGENESAMTNVAVFDGEVGVRNPAVSGEETILEKGFETSVRYNNFVEKKKEFSEKAKQWKEKFEGFKNKVKANRGKRLEKIGKLREFYKQKIRERREKAKDAFEKKHEKKEQLKEKIREKTNDKKNKRGGRKGN